LATQAAGSTDWPTNNRAAKDPAARLTHFSDQLPPDYFAGLVSESYNPAKNRFEKKRGARNEPLDTWGYSYAAAHHPELRLHRYTAADWDRVEARLVAAAETTDLQHALVTDSHKKTSPQETAAIQSGAPPRTFARDW
jgi:phage terminase large subunit GpA-like protein